MQKTEAQMCDEVLQAYGIENSTGVTDLLEAARVIRVVLLARVTVPTAATARY